MDNTTLIMVAAPEDYTKKMRETFLFKDPNCRMGYIKFPGVIITIDFCLSIIVLPSAYKPGPISPVFYV